MKTILVLSLTLLVATSFGKSLEVGCTSDVNGDNSISLTIENGQVVKAVSFMEFTMDYGSLNKLGTLPNGRVRMVYASDSANAVYEVDASVLSTGLGRIHYPDNSIYGFDCTPYSK